MCVCCVGGVDYCVQVQLFPDVCDVFQHSLYFSFAICFLTFLFFSLKILRNAKFPKIYDGLWKPNKKQHPNNFSKGSPWPTLIRNSMVCLWGPLLCPAASWGFFWKIPFILFLC